MAFLTNLCIYSFVSSRENDLIHSPGEVMYNKSSTEMALNLLLICYTCLFIYIVFFVITDSSPLCCVWCTSSSLAPPPSQCHLFVVDTISLLDYFSLHLYPVAANHLVHSKSSVIRKAVFITILMTISGSFCCVLVVRLRFYHLNSQCLIYELQI